ncbi:MAG: hypothetical protein ACE5EL_04245, partial [Anaerolineae bacterium]
MTGVLFPLIARGPMVGRREVDRYAAWRAALAAVAADFRRAPVAVEDLASYLAGVPADQQGEAALDLVAAHLDIAWRASAGPTLEDYVAALGGVRPELASLGGLARDLIEDEFLARHNVPHGDAPTIAEYAARFPGREDVLALLAARALGDGRYILLRRLGRGGEGEVWQAHDRHLGRHVAVKTLAAGAGEGGERARLLATEARRAAALDHPGVVTIHDYSAPPDASPFYVMGLLDGPTLADQIRGYHNPPFDRPGVDQRLLWRRLLAEFTFACRAVAAAHDRGVV